MVAMPTLEFVDEDLPPVSAADAPPPKRRGRPPGSRNRTSGTDSSPRAPRRGSRASIKVEAVALVGAVNLGLAMSPARDDALSDDESDLLAEALTEEAMHSERILAWMQKAGAISPHLLMLRAIVTIATPRLQRRGILPMPSDEQVTAALRQQGYSDEQISEWFRAAREQNGSVGASVPVAAG